MKKNLFITSLIIFILIDAIGITWPVHNKYPCLFISLIGIFALTYIYRAYHSEFKKIETNAAKFLFFSRSVSVIAFLLLLTCHFINYKVTTDDMIILVAWILLYLIEELTFGIIAD